MAQYGFGSGEPGSGQRHQKWYYLAAAVAVAIVALAAAFAEYQNRIVHDQRERAAVTTSLGMVRARLEGDINGNIQLVRGLVSTIAAEPDMSRDRFDAIARGLFETQSQLRNIAGAPDLVVSFMYPLAGNEQAVGLDYNEHPEQRAAALRALEQRDLVLAGPLDMVQGGIGLIGRYPVFVDDADGEERFWGLVAAVVDVRKLYQASGLLDANLPIDIAIRGKDGLGAAGDRFFGPSRVFGEDPVLLDVRLPSGSWQMAAVPKAGWQQMPPNTWLLRAIFTAAALLIAMPIVVAGRLVDERQQHLEDVRLRERRLDQLSQRLELALATSKIGVWEMDIGTGVMTWDDRTRELYGIAPDTPVERLEHWLDRLHPEDRPAVETRFRDALTVGQRYRAEFRVVLPDGVVRTVRAIGMTFLDEEMNRKIIGVNWDVTADIETKEKLFRAKTLAEERAADLELARQQMEYNALHDPLTDLPNRRYLDKVLADGGPSPTASRADLVLMHLDLDRFKAINDTMGHASGDFMLRHCAEVLRSCVRFGDFVARIGGDEFVIVMQRPIDDAALAALAEDLIEKMRRPVRCDGAECRIGVSIGIAVTREGLKDPRQLLVDADIALYKAKRSGRGRYAFFEEALQTEVLRLKNTEDEVLGALEREEFVAWYQPQFDARTYRLCGVEALARWAHPTRGILAPSAFLPTAEELNVVAAIDERILRQALLQSARWMAHGHKVPHLSVNVSAARLRDDKLIETLATLGIPPGAVSFELLESTFFDDSDTQMMATIAELEKLGIDIEVDDFGSGHASFVSLLKLRPRRLKIDRQLVFPITASASQRELVGSIVNIGRSMQIDVIAEGVETMEHAALLRDMGCNILQGYAFARPMSAEQFLEFQNGGQETARVTG